ncbi:MAG TPA: hypothetical protein PKI14_04420 [Fervidobacterium sp.]|nr:hypothetical protein [Fervidobacterium sp.]
MNKIINRKQFQILIRGSYEWLKRNRPDLLDKYLPTKRKKISLEVKLLFIKEFCKKYEKFPVVGGILPNETRLNAYGYELLKSKFSCEIKKLKSRYGRNGRTVCKINDFIAILPNNIYPVNPINTMNEKAVFFHDGYGEFNAIPTNLYLTIKKGGKIGHIKSKKVLYIQRQKSIVRSDGKMYPSISDARMEGFSGVSFALKNGTKCKGYTWKYVDEEEE